MVSWWLLTSVRTKQPSETPWSAWFACVLCKSDFWPLWRMVLESGQHFCIRPWRSCSASDTLVAWSYSPLSPEVSRKGFWIWTKPVKNLEANVCHSLSMSTDGTFHPRPSAASHVADSVDDGWRFWHKSILINLTYTNISVHCSPRFSGQAYRAPYSAPSLFIALGLQCVIFILCYTSVIQAMKRCRH